MFAYGPGEGDKITFAFAFTHHQNSSQEYISTVIYVNFALVLFDRPSTP